MQDTTRANQPENRAVQIPPRFRCTECRYKTMFEGGASSHSSGTGHFVTDAPLGSVHDEQVGSEQKQVVVETVGVAQIA